MKPKLLAQNIEPILIIVQPPFMEPEDIINLFDSCWFNQEIFKKTRDKPTSSTLERNPDPHIQENSSKLEISSQLTIQTRSKSEQLMSPKTSMNYGSSSPNSVLAAPHLQSILSGIEGEAEAEFTGTPQTSKDKSDEKKKKKRKKMKKVLSKSLSELEFEELKGFMDLGFVFSEEDKKDSALVEIIPGLQRLGREKNIEADDKSSSSQDESSNPRPYLSEAWETLGRRKTENPLIHWRFPSVSNEIGMKDNLKWWAHVVASAVR